MDFSAQALPIGVKFYMTFWPHLVRVFSHFGGIAPRMDEFWASTGAIWWDMLLAEALSTGFPLSFDIEIQGLSKTLKFHFQGPILDGSLQHEQ